jgi:S-DNA-T family DNA segregation ATPase FtsK/SpoIIIE
VFLALATLPPPVRVTGAVGGAIGGASRQWFGLGAAAFPLVPLFWAVVLFGHFDRSLGKRVTILLAGLAFTVPFTAGAIYQYTDPAARALLAQGQAPEHFALAGLVGLFLAYYLRALGPVGEGLLALGLFSALTVSTVGWNPWQRLKKKPAAAGGLSARESVPEPVEEVIAEMAPEPAEPAAPRGARRRPKPAEPGASQSAAVFPEELPPIELLNPPVAEPPSFEEELQRLEAVLGATLREFKVEGTIVGRTTGPVVTQFEVVPAAGVKVGRIAALADDLALAMRAQSIRIVAPIPGKGAVGVEVPNPTPRVVAFRELLESAHWRRASAHLPIILGQDLEGRPIVADLAKMPHLLIAGATGSGKSVCINTILLSILMTRTPSQVKLILVDPKMVELQAYKRVPHLCCDVVTNMKKAPGVLQWAVDEMENRYALLSAAGVNHIRNYNRLGQQELAKRLQREPDPARVPLAYVVIVIDEFADLMNVAQNEVEELIQRLAQKSRAVGMHVILATQRPSSEVITGIIKANLPCQIAFKVNRRIDSRVILDANGAEKLLGFGDMLYMPPGGAALLRAQGTFVADDEMQAVVRFLEEQGQEPQFTPSLVQTQSSSRPAVADRDERYREAVEIVLGQQRGSATLLQRALAVGYTRATRLLELMEEDGLVGPFVGSKSRDVLLTIEEWRAREEQREAMEEEAVDEGGGEAAGDAETAPDGEPVTGAGDSATDAPPFLLDAQGAPLPDDEGRSSTASGDASAAAN